GRAYSVNGRYEDAMVEFQKAKRLEDQPMILGGLGYAYAKSGQRAAAREALAELSALAQRRPVRWFDIAVIYSGLGDNDQALEWLEKAYADHHPSLVWLRTTPFVDGLRSDPRFGDLLRRIGLPPHSMNSIAVLPLKNLSGDPEQEYFADGMTEA